MTSFDPRSQQTKLAEHLEGLAAEARAGTLKWIAIASGKSEHGGYVYSWFADAARSRGEVAGAAVQLLLSVAGYPAPDELLTKRDLISNAMARVPDPDKPAASA